MTRQQIIGNAVLRGGGWIILYICAYHYGGLWLDATILGAFTASPMRWWVE